MRRLPILALLVAAPLATLAAPKRPGLAVMDVRAVQGVQPGTATLITDIIVTEVSGTRRYDVVGSADIASLLGLEKQKQLLQCGEDSSCLAELGGALGVDYLLSGSVGLLGSRLRISLSIQNVKRARVVARQARFCDANEDALVRATEETVRALLHELESANALAKQPGPPPPSQDEARPPPPPAPPPSLAPPPPREPPAPGKPLLSRRGWAYVVGGAGLAIVAAGGTFDYLAYASYQDQKDATTQAEFDDALDAGKSRATIANVLYGAGLAAVGAGAYLWFTGPGDTQVAVVPTEGGALVTVAGVLP